MKLDHLETNELHALLQEIKDASIIIAQKQHIIKAIENAIAERYLNQLNIETMKLEPALHEQLLKYDIKTLQRWADCFLELSLYVPRELYLLLDHKKAMESDKLMQQLIKEEAK